jgi:hypothetical protein
MTDFRFHAHAGRRQMRALSAEKSTFPEWQESLGFCLSGLFQRSLPSDITRLAGDPDMLALYFQIQERELNRKAVTDPRAAVAVDVAALRAIPALPAAWLVSGLVYDVVTGLVEAVVPPPPIRVAEVSEVA